MTIQEDFKEQLFKLLEVFESEKHEIQSRPAVGTPNLVFANIVLINMNEKDPYENSFIGKDVIRSEIPQIYTWLFHNLAKILTKLPNYNGMTKVELFGRLGNTVRMAEKHEPRLEPMEKVAALFADVYEAGLDLIEGNQKVMPVAYNGAVADDFETRTIQPEYVDLETFQKELFGGEN
jgi:hypothetical protein